MPIHPEPKKFPKLNTPLACRASISQRVLIRLVLYRDEVTVGSLSSATTVGPFLDVPKISQW